MGFSYGVALRAWMRLVSTDPEFSWVGTSLIVAAFTVLGIMAGLVTAGRRLGWRRGVVASRVIGIVLSMACFQAAGAAMLPAVVPAALGVARDDWPRWLRWLLVGAGAAVAVAIVVTLPDLRLVRHAVAGIIFLAMVPVEVQLLARLYEPSLPPGTLRSRRRKIIPAFFAAALLAGLAVLIVGV